jgi:hypothetical protein
MNNVLVNVLWAEEITNFSTKTKQNADHLKQNNSTRHESSHGSSAIGSKLTLAISKKEIPPLEKNSK